MVEDREVENGLLVKLTLDEYLYEMNQKEYLQPSLTDFNDPLYNKKYPHNMVPLVSYRFKPFGWD